MPTQVPRQYIDPSGYHQQYIPPPALSPQTELHAVAQLMQAIYPIQKIAQIIAFVLVQIQFGIGGVDCVP
ncbi:MAG: hypothetical protein KGL39_16925 [Patescibacteria group bacterium]|nr:hypothetical protein [Patescibacteria group bacterium]